MTNVSLLSLSSICSVIHHSFMRRVLSSSVRRHRFCVRHKNTQLSLASLRDNLCVFFPPSFHVVHKATYIFDQAPPAVNSHCTLKTPFFSSAPYLCVLDYRITTGTSSHTQEHTFFSEITKNLNCFSSGNIKGSPDNLV
jgi:hypothetical protein